MEGRRVVDLQSDMVLHGMSRGQEVEGSNSVMAAVVGGRLLPHIFTRR